MPNSCMSIILLIGAFAVSGGHATAEPRDFITKSIAELCPEPDLSGFQAQIALPGSWFTDEMRQRGRTKVTLALSNGDVVELERLQLQERLRQFRASYFVRRRDGLYPRLQAVADGQCALQAGRAIRGDGDPWRLLDQLASDLTTVRSSETLQAPWPTGLDPGGVRVALIDSGLAYDLPIFRNRLARDADGRPLGYDFWDMDPYPYDGDTSRSPFLPIRHGTAVASILAREAPEAVLVPYRYPRPDMARMDQLVERAASDGVRILALPLGSRHPEDWQAFSDSLSRHRILAIVSAGNDGRDIDIDPVYPASLDLASIVTVTSADGLGKLAIGSNWGARSVDLMVPAENLAVTNFRGASGVASGSSYAVPRVAALAARLLRQEPQLSAAELKSRIFARAVRTPFAHRDAVAVGWIANPSED